MDFIDLKLRFDFILAYKRLSNEFCDPYVGVFWCFRSPKGRNKVLTLLNFGRPNNDKPATVDFSISSFLVFFEVIYLLAQSYNAFNAVMSLGLNVLASPRFLSLPMALIVCFLFLENAYFP